jgi:hypothetical protein
MISLIIGIPIMVLLLFIAFEVGKFKGALNIYDKILKNNPDYYLTEDLIIEETWGPE